MNVTSAVASVLVKPREPVNFKHALTYFTRRAGELVDRAEDGAYRRLFLLPQGPVLTEARSLDSGAVQLSLTPASGVWGSAAEAETATVWVAATLRRTLGLDDDLSAFRIAVSADEALSAIVARYAGLRLISTPTAFEAFVWAVIGQQISLHVAFSLKAALVKRYGVEADVAGVSYWAFPTPETLAEQHPDALAALGLGRRKAATIVNTAAAVASGELDLDALAQVPLDEAEATLVALHGVGAWTAHYTLLRGLRVADACPVSDIGLRAACGRLLGLGRNATVDEVAASAERWRPYRGYAAFYLWFMLSDSRRESDG